MKKIVLLLVIMSLLLASCDWFFDEEASRKDPQGKLYCLEVLQEKYPDLHFEFNETSQRHSIGCMIIFPNGAYIDANEYLLNQVLCDD